MNPAMNYDSSYMEPCFNMDNAPHAKSYQDESCPIGIWIACHEPERPFDPDHTGLHDCCTPCLISLTAFYMMGGKVTMEGSGKDVLIQMVERLEEFGEAPS